MLLLKRGLDILYRLVFVTGPVAFKDKKNMSEKRTPTEYLVLYFEFHKRKNVLICTRISQRISLRLSCFIQSLKVHWYLFMAPCAHVEGHYEDTQGSSTPNVTFERLNMN